MSYPTFVMELSEDFVYKRGAFRATDDYDPDYVSLIHKQCSQPVYDNVLKSESAHDVLIKMVGHVCPSAM